MLPIRLVREYVSLDKIVRSTCSLSDEHQARRIKLKQLEDTFKTFNVTSRRQINRYIRKHGNLDLKHIILTTSSTISQLELDQE